AEPKKARLTGVLENSPFVQKTTNATVFSNMSMVQSDHTAERDAESMAFAKGRVVENEDSVFEFCRPRSVALRSVASDITAYVSAELENRLSVGLAGGAGDEPIPAASLPNVQQHQSGNATKDPLEEVRNWLRLLEKGKVAETKTYFPIQQFLLFSMREIDGQVDDRQKDRDLGRLLQDYCRILPFKNVDTGPQGKDDQRRVDIGLYAQGVSDGRSFDSIKLQQDIDYSSTFAVIEVKPDSLAASVRQALAQLLLYSRNMYAMQPNRRFIWGITMCGNEVRTCLFSNDIVFSSSAMDITTAAGRRQFVELLVNFSLCEIDQLGYDPTIRWCPEHNCWAIEGPDTAGKSSGTTTTKTYYSDKQLLSSADELFGRHRRCFLVTDEEPTDGSIAPKFILKDAWPEAEEDPAHDKRSEIRFMRRIATELAQSDIEDPVYPKFHAGGRVHIDANGEVFEDNVKNILGSLFSLRKPDGAAIPFRVHTRVIMDNIGKPLKHVESVHELIVVLGDVMRCHSEILKRCSILHRCITDSNILVVREEGKPVCGLLIDFDSALDVGQARAPVRSEQTCALPYASINRLLAPDVEQTELDDWESLVYLICWYATIGICRDKKDRRHPASMRGLAISKWRNGTPKEIGEAKKDHLDTLKSICVDITDYFHLAKDIDILQNLVEDLYEDLFQNPDLRKDDECDGSRYRGTKFGKRRGEYEPPNPFKERLEKKSEITTALLKTMTEAWKSSRNICIA
ncbi:hypothetical protein EC988_000737, partial [Linderina pennispora]